MDLALRTQLALTLPLALSRFIARTGRSRLGAQCARVLMFHGTPRRQARELEGQLAYLKREFEIVPLAALIGAPPSRLAGRLALTFDDGLRNHVTVLYPILRKLALPATFFVCPLLIDRGAWLWNHDLRERLRSLGLAARHALAEKVGAPRAGLEDFVQWTKELDLASRQRVERRVRDATGSFQPSREQRDEFDLASWHELKSLDPALVTIGSHTLTHPILTSIDERQTEVEIGESRRLIEKRVGRRCELFCYPNGNVNDAALQTVRRHYRAAVTTSPGWLVPGTDPHLVPRDAPPRGVLRLAWNVYR